jgi:uncharacterized RDD family membrane protein YckC
MTDAPETAAPQDTAPAPAPVRARALAGLIDLVPADAVVLLLLWQAGQAGLLIGLLLVVVVYSVCEAKGGQTPGKRLMGLRDRRQPPAAAAGRPGGRYVGVPPRRPCD